MILLMEWLPIFFSGSCHLTNWLVMVGDPLMADLDDFVDGMASNLFFGILPPDKSEII